MRTNFRRVEGWRRAELTLSEIDKMGMGRYQWCIWLLCGFG